MSTPYLLQDLKGIQGLSRIFKQGRCRYETLDLPRGTDGKDSPQGHTDETEKFSSLSVLIPGMSTPVHDQKGADRGKSTAQVDTSDGGIDEQAQRTMAKALKRAKEIESEAQAVLAQARKRAEEIESKAYDEGFAQGRLDGEELGKKQFEAMARRLEKLIEKIGLEGNRILPKYEAQMVELSLAMARHIIGEEVKTGPEAVLSCIRSAMEKVIEGSRVHIHLNPDDMQLIEGKIEKHIRPAGGHQVDMVSDASIDKGGCLIETEFGLVDATMDSRWRAIEKEMRKTLSERYAASGQASSAPSKTEV